MPRFLTVLTRNWQLKLLAFALAVLLWIVVSAEQVTSNWMPVPLLIEVTDGSYQLRRESIPGEVRVRFVGPGREFFDLAVRRPPLLLRVDEVERAEQVFELDPRMVRLPNELDVSASDVDPAFVRLRFRRMAFREVPVRVRVAAGPGLSYTLVDSLRVSPDRIQISGPAEQIARIDAVSTVPVSVPERDASFDQLVALDTTQLGEVHPSVPRVRVVGRVERTAQRNMGPVPIAVGRGYVVRPQRVEVSVQGGRRAVETLRPEDFRVVVSIDSIPASIPPSGIQVPLRVEGLPNRVTATGVTPAAVLLYPSGEPLDSVAETPDSLPVASDPP